MTIKMLERLLETIRPQTPEQVTHLARWTHHLVSALFHRGSTRDEVRAYTYLDKIVTMLDSQMGPFFPDDETKWFASIAWSKGMSKFK